VMVPFLDGATPDTTNGIRQTKKHSTTQTMGCLELCMYAEGSRHQEEIIVTGTKVC
jgi:hypothetical protein